MLRGLIGLAILGLLAYGAVAIPLGERTLWGHITAIAESKEGKKLVDGVKTKADEVLDKAPEKKKGEPASRPADDFTPRERKALKELIKERLEKKEREAAQKRRPKAGAAEKAE